MPSSLGIMQQQMEAWYSPSPAKGVTVKTAACHHDLLDAAVFSNFDFLGHALTVGAGPVRVAMIKDVPLATNLDHAAVVIP